MTEHETCHRCDRNHHSSGTPDCLRCQLATKDALLKEKDKHITKLTKNRDMWRKRALHEQMQHLLSLSTNLKAQLKAQYEQLTDDSLGGFIEENNDLKDQLKQYEQTHKATCDEIGRLEKRIEKALAILKDCPDGSGDRDAVKALRGE